MAVVSFSVPKYRHHKGSGQAFVQVKGKRHYLGRYGTPDSKERYARFVAELAASPVVAAAGRSHREHRRLDRRGTGRCLPRVLQGLLPQEGRHAQRLARSYPACPRQASSGVVRPHAGRRLRPQGFQGHPAAAGRRRQFPALRQQVDADRDQVFQVGGERRTDSRLRLPRPDGRGRTEEGSHRPPGSRPRSCPSRKRSSMPRCPTCPRSWPIWSGSSG